MLYIIESTGQVHSCASVAAAAPIVESLAGKTEIRAIVGSGGIEYVLRRPTVDPSSDSPALVPVGPVDRAALLKAIEADQRKSPSESSKQLVVFVEELRQDLEKEQEAAREYGPVIAWGVEGDRGWIMRGRLGERSATCIVGGPGGEGPLPFEEVGGARRGYFGIYAYGGPSIAPVPIAQRPRTLAGVVSKEVASVEVLLANGAMVAARIVDTGHPRASFFVAAWAVPVDWKTMVAKDFRGRRLESHSPTAQRARP
jgi:hypothetical protein